MEAILFIAHGSKKAACNNEIKYFIAALKSKLNSKNIELCYIEFAQPLIQEGIDNCAQKGCTKIIAMPLLLSDAGHAKEDIPKEIETAKIKFPQIEFCYGKPIGLHDKMHEILLTRLQETKCIIDQNTAVILVAKGSRFESANNELRIISKQFRSYCEAGIVKASFLSMTFPKLQDVIDECIAEGATKFVILPYILFQGLLIRKIAEYINELTMKYPSHTFLTANHIGSHSLLYEIIKERIEEVQLERRGLQL